MQITSAALFISVSLVIFGISYYYFTTRHRERMTLIEKGLAPDYFKDSISYLPFILLLGIVSIGIAFGIIAGYLLSNVLPSGKEGLILSFSVFLFLGISLLISFYTLRALTRKRKKDM